MNFKAALRYLLLPIAIAVTLGTIPAKSGAKDFSSTNASGSTIGAFGSTTGAAIAGISASGGGIGPAYSAIFAVAPQPGTWAAALGGLGVLVCLQRLRRSHRI